MVGKTVLITGGNVGIGYETALEMARRGAKVIIGCRRTDGLKEKIEATIPNSQIDVFHLDLSLKQSVLDFCRKVKAGHDKIHVLINNSAIVSRPENSESPNTREMSTDGKHELTMATNYIGHCILNNELMDLVAAAGQDGDYARIIIVSSVVVFMLTGDLHLTKKFDLDAKLVDPRKFDKAKQYANSKQAQILYTRKLARKLKSDGINAVVCANCPGLVNTKISDGMMSWKRMIFTTAGWFLGKDCKMGAQCTDYLATENLPKNEINEGFFMDCHTFNFLMNMRAPEEKLDDFWNHTQQLMNA